MNSIKVSIVVPICNVEKYLDECLKSISNQTLKEIEIICVDDGSKDNSLKIAKKWQKRDKRFIVLTKKNSGYGNTMNVGIDNAHGEYLGIVESDDYVDKHMFEVLYSAAANNDLDVVKSDYVTFKTRDNAYFSEYEPVCLGNVEYYNKVLCPVEDTKTFTFQLNTWTGLYKLSFLNENNIRHNETPGASYQDNGFWFQTFALAKRVMFVNQAFYHYRQDNPNSSINSKGKVFCMNEEYNFIREFLFSHKDIKDKLMMPYFYKRFYNYMHTYERIAEEYKLDFLMQFSKELHESYESGRFNLFDIPDEWIKGIIARIYDDYRLFYYEDTIWKLERKLDDANFRLSKVRNSRELVVGRKYADKILHLLRRK